MLIILTILIQGIWAHSGHRPHGSSIELPATENITKLLDSAHFDLDEEIRRLTLVEDTMNIDFISLNNQVKPEFEKMYPRQDPATPDYAMNLELMSNMFSSQLDSSHEKFQNVSNFPYFEENVRKFNQDLNMTYKSPDFENIIYQVRFVFH